MAQAARLGPVLQKKKLSDARSWFVAECSKSTSIKRLSQLVQGNCIWFRSRRRRPIRKNFLLTSDEWDRVKQVVSFHLHLIQGRSLDDAVEIVRSDVSCSARILMGLVPRLHVWDVK